MNDFSLLLLDVVEVVFMYIATAVLGGSLWVSIIRREAMNPILFIGFILVFVIAVRGTIQLIDYISV